MATVIFDKVVKAYDNGVTVLHEASRTLDCVRGNFLPHKFPREECSSLTESICAKSEVR